MEKDTKAIVDNYISGVLSGEILACKWVKLAVKRHVDDFKRPHFGYHFNEGKAQRAIDFIQDYCVHVKGHLAGKPLILDPWQLFCTWVLFGWVDDDGFRRFNIAFIEVGKKNGKSTWLAAIALYAAFADGEVAAEVYSVAVVKDQANIVFEKYAKTMVKLAKELKSIVKVYSHALVDVATETSVFKSLSSEHDSLDGKHAHFVTVDEYHAHKTDFVYKTMVENMSANRQPMTMIITTAGFDPDVPCVDEEEYAQRVLTRKAINESYFGIIFTLDEGDDWADKTLWGKPNPSLGTAKTFKAMEASFQKAVDMPSEQNKFKNKHLNIWTKNQTLWIRDDDWAKVETVFDIEEMKGAKAYAGIDLAQTIDSCSYVLTIPWEDKFRIVPRVYLPEFNIDEREKKERFEWRRMADEGYVDLTIGRTTDYEYIQRDLEADMEFFDLKEIAYDPYNSSMFIANLEKLGWEKYLVEFSQSWKYISPASKDFESKVLNGLIEIQHNPVVSWMVENAQIKRDANGNIRPVKPETRGSSKHIDAVIATIMSLDRAVRNVKKESVYAKRGLLTINY